MPSDARCVLLVSRDATLREDATYSFPSEFEVLVADDARDAIRVVGSRTPDIAIVDIRTGSSGGFNLTREMQNIGSLRDVPVLMLLERRQDGWLAEQAGAQRWRTKPVEGTDLVQEALSLLPS